MEQSGKKPSCETDVEGDATSLDETPESWSKEWWMPPEEAGDPPQPRRLAAQGTPGGAIPDGRVLQEKEDYHQ
ncbi:hypothetical protein NDU88_005330 [Pleurodeles waltl]|uniref:Uncharacterized protein n=1 Tax=Pleurodeles waltl TaxID=8319 RepID=A0AAV7TUI0_PLEWA|nr:hypothetical protein NDU88_005330 [Pleurodeles waltl]